MMSGHPLLQVSELSIGFLLENGLVPAIQQVSFEIERGETLAIVGESGSGKSVTSLSILGLLPSPPAVINGGEILFSEDGKHPVDLLTLNHDQLRDIRGKRIAMIFQEPMTSLNPVISCGEQVAEAIMAHENISTAEAKQRAVELFHKVRLPEPLQIYDRYPHQLSGGQKQRIMIAMAMSCSPALLICDEPTTALDVTVQKSILELINELKQEYGMGVIFISHDLGLVAEIADRIAVMYKGKLVEQGKAGVIYHSPQHPYTKALLACRPANHPKGSPLPVVSDFLNAQTISTSVIHKRYEPTQEDHSILCVKDLTVRYGHFTAVDKVSFDIRKGETVGLVGESGCGKTTLGRSLLKLIEPSEGKIIFEGKDISILNPMDMRSLRKKMQLIFQDPYSSLNPRIRIGTAMDEVLQVHTQFNQVQRKKKIMEMLERVGLHPDHYNRYPHEFSGGQRQRIVIARALILEPSFVICDESVSALDVSVQAQVLNLLNELKDSFEFTALFISHDLAVVKYISDRIMVMSQGKIVESGSSEQVYNHPAHPYTARLLEAIPGKKL